MTLARSFALLLLVAAPAEAKPCPKLEPGAAYPWQTDVHYPDDGWAELRLTVNERGQPVDCSVLRSRLSDPDYAPQLCAAQLEAGHVALTDADGKPKAGVVTVKTQLIGRRHAQADEIARKKWFAAHPDERSDCYPY